MRPLALALDTSTPTLTCAVVAREPGGVFVLSTRDVAPPAITSTVVPGLFDELLAEAGGTIADVGVLVCGLGPGLFTGTRVAAGTLKAVAYARGLPLVGAGSLEAMALAASRGAPLAKGDRVRWGEPPANGGVLAPVLDARKGEVYAALYRFAGTQPEPVEAPAAMPPAELAARLRARAEPVLVFGSGLAASRGLLAAEGPIALLDAPLFPGAAEIASLALERAPEPVFDLVSVLALEPTYLRPPEAEVARQKRGPPPAK